MRRLMVGVSYWQRRESHRPDILGKAAKACLGQIKYARTARLVRIQDVALQHKHRKTICQCNHKYDGGESCGIPYLDDAVKQLFLKAVNIVFSEKDSVRENYDSIKDTLFGTSELEAERFNEAKERLSEVSQAITEQRVKHERTGREGLFLGRKNWTARSRHSARTTGTALKAQIPRGWERKDQQGWKRCRMYLKRMRWNPALTET